MRISLIVNLSLWGLILGALNSFGITTEWQWFAWLAHWLAASRIIIRRAPSRPGLHLAATGFLFAFCVYVTQALLIETYAASNPGFIVQLKQLAPDMLPIRFMLSLGTLVSTANAAILLLVGSGMRKFAATRERGL